MIEEFVIAEEALKHKVNNIPTDPSVEWIEELAKNIVASGLANECEIQLAYAIGVADPVSIMVDTHGTGQVDDEAIVRAIRKVFELTPRGIIESLDLRKPIFRDTACYGHFGREKFTWEKTDKIEDIKRAVK